VAIVQCLPVLHILLTNSIFGFLEAKNAGGLVVGRRGSLNISWKLLFTDHLAFWSVGLFVNLRVIFFIAIFLKLHADEVR
jgi:hypothetical protein